MSDQILNDKPSSLILVSDGGQKSGSRLWRSRRVLILFGFGAIIVLAGIAGALTAASHSHKEPVATRTSNIYDKDYSQAVAGLHAADSQQAKAKAYIKLAQAEFNLGKYQTAIKDYNNALATNQPSVEKDALAGLAYSYAMTNQRDKAIQTFSALIALIKKQDPNNSMAIEDYQAELTRLKEGKSL